MFLCYRSVSRTPTLSNHCRHNPPIVRVEISAIKWCIRLKVSHICTANRIISYMTPYTHHLPLCNSNNGSNDNSNNGSSSSSSGDSGSGGNSGGNSSSGDSGSGGNSGNSGGSSSSDGSDGNG